VWKSEESNKLRRKKGHSIMIKIRILIW
jgi:hypothetical protein